MKSTYNAVIRVPAPLRALMSAVAQPSDASDESGGGPGFNSWRFRQAVPIPSYLVALAVGELEGKSIGPVTTVTPFFPALLLSHVRESMSQSTGHFPPQMGVVV